MKHNEQIETGTLSRQALTFARPSVYDNGTIRKVTAGLPEEILDETADFFCIEAAVRLRARE